MAATEYPTFNTQAPPLQNGAIPTYPTPSVAPLAGNPLNTYSQVQGSLQASQNMRNQSQQMKRDQISFQEQQKASHDTAAGPLQPGTPDYDRYQQTGLLPGEQPHQSFLQGIVTAVQHGMHALSGVVHGGQGPGAVPAPTAVGVPPPQGPPSSLADPAATPLQGPAAPIQSQMHGGVVQGNQPPPAFLQGPTTGDPGPHSTILAFGKGGAIPHYDQGGQVLNTFAQSGAGNISANSTPGAGSNPTPDSGAASAVGAQALNTIIGGAGAVGGAPTAAAGAGATAGDAASGLGSALSFFQSGGEVPSPSPAYGIHDGGVRGLRGFAQGGEVPGGTAPAPPTPQAAQATFVQNAEASSAHLHELALDDSGQPGNARGIPSTGPVPVPGVNAPDAPPAQTTQAAPAAGSAAAAAPAAAPAAQGTPAPASNSTGTTAVLKAAATDSTALAGQVSTTPAAEGKPKSISMEDWDKSDQLIQRAAVSAALAGHDGSAVAESLNANRNAWVQGHVLRWLSVANTKQLANDPKGVVDAMKNAYYYIPDGQELQINKDKSGNIVFQDPIDPPGPDGKPIMRPLTTQSIQQMGVAMLDPMALQNLIMSARTAQSQIQLREQQGLAARDVGRGRLGQGIGAEAHGKAALQRVNSQNWRDLATGEAELTRANAVSNHLNKLGASVKADPTLLRGAQDSAAAFNDLAQGQRVTDQNQMSGGAPNPNFGKTTRDPTKIAPELAGASPGDVMDGAAMAGKIHMGSNGAIAPPEAARLAALYTQQKRNTKAGPKGNMAGVHNDSATGDTWVWNPKTKSWETFKLPVTSGGPSATMGVTSADLDPVAQAELARNSGSAGGAGAMPSPGEETNPAEEDILHNDQAG